MTDCHGAIVIIVVVITVIIMKNRHDDKTKRVQPYPADAKKC